LVDRALEISILSLDETRCIISAIEDGILINWPIEDLERLKAQAAEHERLLKMYLSSSPLCRP